MMKQVEEVLDHDLFTPITGKRLVDGKLEVDLPGIDPSSVELGWKRNVLYIKVDDKIVEKLTFPDGVRKENVDRSYKAGRITFSIKEEPDDLEFDSL